MNDAMAETPKKILVVDDESYTLEFISYNLRRHGFEVYTQAQVPSNDGGISLGQALVADAVYKARTK